VKPGIEEKHPSAVDAFNARSLDSRTCAASSDASGLADTDCAHNRSVETDRMLLAKNFISKEGWINKTDADDETNERISR
jgi:hypothetical protein